MSEKPGAGNSLIDLQSKHRLNGYVCDPAHRKRVERNICPFLLGVKHDRGWREIVDQAELEL
jgi:hypothetical protein